MDQSEVAAAFDVVLEEIDRVIEALGEEGGRAFQSRKYELAEELSKRGQLLQAFRGKVYDLRQEWLRTFAAVAPIGLVRKTEGRQTTRWPQRGQRTARRAFRLPILQALVELGGAAPVARVLGKVEAAMRDHLNEYDYQHLRSDPGQTSWSKSVQWERYEMVKEGLLSSDAGRGIWKITPQGRAYLAAAGKLDDSQPRNEPQESLVSL